MKLIRFNVFETVASDSNDKYHEGACNKLFFNATKSNSIDYYFAVSFDSTIVMI